MKKLFFLFLIMMLPVLAACSPKEERAVQPRLVSTVTEYGIDFETNDWIPVRTWDFSYENGYPTVIDLYEIDADRHVLTAFSYAFEDGVPVVRNTIDEDGDLLSVTEYQNGRIYDVYEKNEIRTNTLYYQYGNGDDYFTMVLREERTADPESHAEEVDSISVTVQNGLLVKTVNTGMYANWGGEEEKQWLRFSGTYTAEYDEDGIVSLSSAVHRVGPSGIDGRYTLTKENGVVTEAVCSVPSGDDWSDTARFTFEYTDIETTPARYAQMINSFLMGSESSYYKYNWY